MEMKTGGVVLFQRAKCPPEKGRVLSSNLSSAANSEAPLSASVSSSVKQKQRIFHRVGMRIIYVPCLVYTGFMVRVQ